MTIKAMLKNYSSKEALLLDYLASPPAGLFGRPFDIYAPGEAPRVSISRVRANLTRLAMPSGIHYAQKIQSGGTGLTPQDAHLPAISEALERYCTSVYSDNQFILASAADMKGECIDLDLIPRCSTTEVAHPRCPLIQPTKKASIRWVKGVDLTEQKVKYVPAIMVYSHLGDILPAERFWFPISTGCAAHFDLNKAIMNAILEVIERDAISLTWLRQLHLPRIVIDKIPAALAQLWDLYLHSSPAVKYEFYDATTDLGVPTVYGLRIAPNSEHARTLVGCCTASTTAEAIRKVLSDLISLSTVFKRPLDHPDKPEDLKDLIHGAAYMAHAKHEASFNFLRQNGRQINLSQLELTQDSKLDLEALLQRLRSRSTSVYAMDLTTDEAQQVNMKVVRVVIPELMPLSFSYLARFLGHSRLYSASLPNPSKVRNESDVNTYPQPFA